MPVVSFSLTSVQYVQGDVLGFLFALFTLSPIFIVVMYATVIITRRDIQTAFTFCGQLVGVVVNLTLKKLISAPRPINSELQDEGMPSNHAQFIAFYCTLQIMKFVFNNSPLPRVYRAIYSFVLMLLATVVCISRVYLHYHSIDQVVVGAVVGSLLASVWYRIEVGYLPRLANCICGLRIAKYLHVRNYNDIQYAPMQEYQLIGNTADSKKK